MRALVHPANVPDREGAKSLLSGVTGAFPRLSHFWADQGYNGEPFADWISENTGCTLTITQHAVERAERPATGITVMPRRWVVERTFAWLCRNRRLSKDYEGLPRTGEALIAMAMVRLMARRLSL